MSDVDTKRYQLAKDVFMADNSDAPSPEREWDIATTKELAYAYAIADGLIAAGWEKPTGDHFKLEATLTSGETVTVKVSGYSNMRQGCAALVKVADVQTLSQIIAGSESDEDWT